MFFLDIQSLPGPDELVIFVTTFQLAVLGSHMNFCREAAIGAVGSLVPPEA